MRVFRILGFRVERQSAASGTEQIREALDTSERARTNRIEATLEPSPLSPKQETLKP